MTTNYSYLTTEQINKITREITLLKDTENSLVNSEYQPDNYDNFDPEQAYHNSLQGQLDDIHTEIVKKTELLYKDSYMRSNSNYIKKHASHVANYSCGKLLSESPQDSDDFDRKEISHNIASMLCQKTTKSPFNIAILGKWGIGKTTFINYIRESINAANHSSKLYCINFDASEYSSSEKIWANIATKLFETYENNFFFAKTKYAYAKIKSNKRKYLTKASSIFFIIFIIFSLTFVTKFSFSFESFFGYIIGIGTGFCNITLLICKIVIPFFHKSVESSISLSNQIANKIKLPNYSTTLGIRNKIASDVSILLSSWVSSDDDKIILLIDELDRCTSNGIIEFFESIQLFINIPNLHFIFAIDPDILTNALKKHYNSTGLFTMNNFVNNFIDKYVAITIPLEANTSYNNYIMNLLKCIDTSKTYKCFSTDEKQAILKSFSAIPNKLLTPRKVKKIINALILLKEYCITTLNSSGNDTVNYCHLFTWYIFSTLYKYEAISLINLYNPSRKFTPLKEVINSSDKNKICENADIAKLFKKI